MDIRPIRSEADYDWALREVERYFDQEPEPGTPEADRFDVLSALIAAYEAKHWPIEPADPVDAITYVMDVRGLTQADLAALLGSRSRASEILSRRRPISKEQAYVIHRAWGVPAECFLQPHRHAYA